MEVLNKWSLSHPGKSLGYLIQGFLQCALNTENLIPKAGVGVGGRPSEVWEGLVPVCLHASHRAVGIL